MTSKQLAIQFVSDYWEMIIVPLSIWLYHQWMSRKIKIIIGGNDDAPKSDQYDKLIGIMATQTEILKKLDDGIQRLETLTSTMKAEDTRVRDNFTKCLDKISEGTDALVGMFNEYRAFEKGRSSARA